MEKQQLREQLQQLTDAVSEMHASTEEKGRLTDLIENIEEQLDEPLTPASANLAEEVETLVSNFEADHPTIAGILNNIMVTLSSMGI